jgi:head-tail adaptor
MSGVHLTRRLVLEDAAEMPDGAGGFAEVWTVRGVIWAEVRAGTGREAADEESWQAEVPFRITVRGAGQGAASRPKAGQRLRDGARLYRILAVTERDPLGLYLVCNAREEVPA